MSHTHFRPYTYHTSMTLYALLIFDNNHNGSAMDSAAM